MALGARLARFTPPPGESLTFSLQNTSGKEIRSVKGDVYATDQFGDNIGRFGVTIDSPLRPGQSVEHTGMWEVRDHRFYELIKPPRSDLKFSYLPEVVLYADGTQERFN